MRGAILSGIVVAIVFGWVSFPSERTIEKTVEDWLPANAASGAVAEQLRAAAEAAATDTVADVARVSEREFRDLNLPLTVAYPAVPEDERSFSIRYAGRESAGATTLYLAEREVANGPWWSPDRWVYKAFKAQTDEFANVLRLTFERDLTGLFALFLMDVIVGGLYACVVGMILAVLGMEGLDKRHTPRYLPAPGAPIPLDPHGIFRA
jgi:hypothetical protein